MTSFRCAVAVLGILVSGCANERTAQWGPAQHLGAGSLNFVAQDARNADAQDARKTDQQDARVADRQDARATSATDEAAEHMSTGATTAKPLRKTLGGKMLSAMALERVTGRKPDPSRLREID